SADSDLRGRQAASARASCRRYRHALNLTAHDRRKAFNANAGRRWAFFADLTPRSGNAEAASGVPSVEGGSAHRLVSRPAHGHREGRRDSLGRDGERFVRRSAYELAGALYKSLGKTNLSWCARP